MEMLPLACICSRVSYFYVAPGLILVKPNFGTCGLLMFQLKAVIHPSLRAETGLSVLFLCYFIIL